MGAMLGNIPDGYSVVSLSHLEKEGYNKGVQETKKKAIKAFEQYLDTYHGDYTDKDIERFKLILERIGDE